MVRTLSPRNSSGIPFQDYSVAFYDKGIRILKHPNVISYVLELIDGKRLEDLELGGIDVVKCSVS